MLRHLQPLRLLLRKSHLPLHKGGLGTYNCRCGDWGTEGPLYTRGPWARGTGKSFSSEGALGREKAGCFLKEKRINYQKREVRKYLSFCIYTIMRGRLFSAARPRPPLTRADFPVSGENVREADKRGAGPAGLSPHCGDWGIVTMRTTPPSRRSAAHGRLSSKCNTSSQNFGWSFPAKTFPGTIVDQVFDNLNIFISNRPKIKPFWKEKTDNIVRILVCSALPRFMRLGKVDKGV